MLMPPLQSIFPMNKETNMRLFPDCPVLEESMRFCFSCDFLLMLELKWALVSSELMVKGLEESTKLKSLLSILREKHLQEDM